MMESFKKTQVNFYKKYASSYDQIYKRENRNHINKIKKISSFLNLKSGQKVLEIAAGTGVHAQHFLTWNPNVKYTGVDLSHDMLQVCKKRLNKFSNITLKSMDAENLTFKDNSFDAVYISSALHHFNNLEKGVKEIVRVLKPGGKFAIMEPNYKNPYNFLVSKVIKAEKHTKFIQRSYFTKWLKGQSVTMSFENMAYTPPFPKGAIPIYDLIDTTCNHLPIINRMSIMLFVKGQKLR